jgi:glutamate--cysteine ligase
MALSYDDLLLPFHEAMKPKEQWRIGAEAEKFGVMADTGQALLYDQAPGVLTVLSALQERFGWKPMVEREGGPLIALERDHASVTLEPGGQLELSGAPLSDIHAIADETAAHHRDLAQISDPLGIVWLGVGFHPFARQDDLPWVPKMRYGVMKTYLPTRGARALDMMRRTATVQANFDYGTEEDALRKLRVALRISPLVSAIFANSPFREGRITGDRSERTRVWLAVDPDRQGLLPRMWSESSRISDYIEWALDAPMFLIKRGGEVVHNTGQTFRAFLRDGYSGHTADIHDWETHLNTLFPEVRLKRTLEVRGGDSLPARLSAALPALWTGALYDDSAFTEVERWSSSFTFAEIEALRPHVAERGLRAVFRGRPLAEAAERLLDLAEQGLRRRARKNPQGEDETVHLRELGELIHAGDCPADALLRELPEDPAALTREIIRRAQV